MPFAPSAKRKICAFVFVISTAPTLAENGAPAPQLPGDNGATALTADTVEIISEKLDTDRLQIQPSLGASTYYFGSDALQTIPQGENAPLNQVMLQMPGVAQDSFGQVHVRGDHANVQSSGRCWNPASRAAFRCSRVPFRRNMGFRPREFSTFRPRRDFPIRAWP